MRAMPRPRSVSRSGETVISNGGAGADLQRDRRHARDPREVVYKAVAYRRVADTVERYPDDVAALFRRGEPPKIAGAGPALTAKLAELSETGRLEYHERLRAQVPDGLLDMLRVPGVGPKTVRLLHAELGIDSLEALRAAAEAGRLRDVKGLSARTEQNVLEGIGRIERARSARASSSTTPTRWWPASSTRCATSAACGASCAGRSAGAGRRSATSTSWPRSTTRRR